MTKTATYICLHTVKRHKVNHPPGAEIDLSDADDGEIDRLLERGAVCRPEDWEELSVLPVGARGGRPEIPAT